MNVQRNIVADKEESVKLKGTMSNWHTVYSRV